MRYCDSVSQNKDCFVGSILCLVCLAFSESPDEFQKIKAKNTKRLARFVCERNQSVVRSELKKKQIRSKRVTTVDFLKGRSLRGLLQSSVLVGTHLHSNALQDLFDSHVAVPVFHCRDLVFLDLPGFGVHAVHIDFRNEFQNGRDGRIVAGAVDSQLVKSVVVLCLREEKRRNR